MFCPQCGREYDDSDPFCGNCGAKNPYVEQPPVQGATVPPAQVAPQQPVPPAQVAPQQPASPGAAPYGVVAYRPPNESSAAASLVLGILSFFLCPIILGVLAIIMGSNSKKKIEQSGGQLGGQGMAQAAIILGWINVILVVVVGIIVALAVPVFLNANANAQKRTCQSNLRTVDSAIQVYEATMPNGEAPTSLDDLMQPGMEVLKSIPTCPSGNEPYIWVPGNPPEISCPNDASHTI